MGPARPAEAKAVWLYFNSVIPELRTHPREWGGGGGGGGCTCPSLPAQSEHTRLQRQSGCAAWLRFCAGLSEQSADILLISFNPPAETLPLTTRQSTRCCLQHQSNVGFCAASSFCNLEGIHKHFQQSDSRFYPTDEAHIHANSLARKANPVSFANKLQKKRENV